MRIDGPIEPVGVAPAFRGQGLGTVLHTACLARLSKLSTDKVFVETDSFRDPALRLYRSAGFEPATDILVFRSDFPGLLGSECEDTMPAAWYPLRAVGLRPVQPPHFDYVSS